MHARDIPNFEKLTDAEKLQLADELIASMSNPEIWPEAPEHRKELDRRWLEFEKNPESALTDEQFWKDVEAARRACAS